MTRDEFDTQAKNTMKQLQDSLKGVPLTVGINATLNILEHLMAQSSPALQKEIIRATLSTLDRAEVATKNGEHDSVH